MKRTPANQGAKQDEYFVVTELFARRMAYPLALFFRRLGMTANHVTILGGLLWVLTVPSIIMAGRLWAQGHTGLAQALLILTVALWNLGYVLDVVDGSLARITGTMSSGGSFLDFCFHLLFHPMFLCSVGVFLFLVTDHLLYLPLAVLATFTGWGLSFSAKEHVLCEHIAKGDADPSRLSQDDRYRIYIDSVRMREPVAAKRGGRYLAALINEVFCFPGQYSLVSLVVILDLLLAAWGLATGFYLLRIAFVVLTVVPMIRVPFRLRREFKTLTRYDALR